MKADEQVSVDWTKLPKWVREDFDALEEVEKGLFLPSLARLADHHALMGPVWKKLSSNREKFAPKGPLHFVLEEIWRSNAYLHGMERHRSSDERKIIADKVSSAVDALIIQLDRLAGAHYFEGYPTSIQAEICAVIQDAVSEGIRSELEFFEGDLEPHEIEDLQVNLEEAAAVSLGDLEPILAGLKSGVRLWESDPSPNELDVLAGFAIALAKRFGGKRQLSLSATLSSIATGHSVSVEAVKYALKVHDARRRDRTSAN